MKKIFKRIELKSSNILEESNVFDDTLLDLISRINSHEHGLGEWLKNAVDAYLRENISDENKLVIFRFIDKRIKKPIMECIDFVGITRRDITERFKRWGDIKAAQGGLKGMKTFGGHGTGGKFYMRDWFNESYLIAYKSGKLNIFGFKPNKKYGFFKGYVDKEILPELALNIANIENLPFLEKIKQEILSGKRGFTVVRGIGPRGMKKEINVERICEKFKNHPQVLRILKRIKAPVVYNKEIVYDHLVPDKIKPKPGFEKPRVIPIPKLTGKLTLHTSEIALERGGRFGDLNRIDIVGEVGVVASYPLLELGVSTFPQAAFIYGECECPAMEKYTQLLRRKLEENSDTQALLEWIHEQIDSFAESIAEEEKNKQEEIEREVSSSYNEYLNKWKNKFMPRVLGELLGSLSGGGRGGIKGRRKKKLEIPPHGFDFSSPVAKIPLNIESPLTLKILIEKIPLGSLITASSDEPEIEIVNPQIILNPNEIKTVKGKEIAVVNFYTIGKSLDAVGTVIAQAGKFTTPSVKVEVIEGTGSGRSGKYPRVLLSGVDDDPLNPGKKVVLEPRHPVVYQRPQDFKKGIYWINTTSSLAQAVLKKRGSNSIEWRNYLFQRYIDIFAKEALYKLEKEHGGFLGASVVDRTIFDNLVSKIHEAGTKDLGAFLFDEKYESELLVAKS